MSIYIAYNKYIFMEWTPNRAGIKVNDRFRFNLIEKRYR